MNIVIVGAGVVGYSLAETLSRQGHYVAVIDRSPKLCKKIENNLDVFTLNGPGTSPSILENSGIRKAHAVIVVTPNDDTNLLVCNFAKQFGVPKRIARIKSSEYTQSTSAISLEEVGASSVIEPEKEVVRNILQYIELPGVTETANFHKDSVYLRGFRVTEGMPIANRTLLQTIHENAVRDILFVLIIRAGKSIIPTGSDTILPGDEIIAIMARQALPAFRKLLNQTERKLKRIIVSGDSLTAVHLAAELKAYADTVLLVDPDESHGQFAASELQGVDVYQGDCTSVETLQEVHVADVPFFIAAGEDTEDNIMSCLLAKAEGASEVITVSTSERHIGLFRSLGLDHVIYPHKITSQSIMGNILRVPIGPLLRLRDVNVEVSRLVAHKRSRIVDKPLNKTDKLLHKSAIIGSVFRGDEVIIPSGETVIRAGDEVLVLSQAEQVRAISRLFRPALTVGA